MSSLGNCFKSARGAGILTSIISLVLITAFSSPAVSQVSDTEYSLLLKRLMKASCHSKYAIEDSIMSVENPDLDLMDRLYASEEYAQIKKPGYYEDLWRQKFESAYYDIKPCIIDSMIYERDVNCELIDDILLTNKYYGQFPSFKELVALRTAIALEIGTGKRQYCSDTRFSYYHNGKKSRYFMRPTGHDIELSRQKRLAELRDPDGTLWAVFYTDWFPKCRNSIWLMKKESGMSKWQGPWFTGRYGPDSAKDPQASLKIMGNSLYLKCSPDNSYFLIDEAFLTRDRDRDRLFDIEEIELGTDPLNRDTDGDGIDDSKDINPLAAGIEFPIYRDMAARSIVRLLAIADEPINIYVLSGDINSDLEFFSDSPNAFFLPDMKYREYSDYDLTYKGSLPISVSVLNENDSLMMFSAVTLDSSMFFYFGKPRQRWRMDSVVVVPLSSSQNSPPSKTSIPNNR